MNRSMDRALLLACLLAGAAACTGAMESRDLEARDGAMPSEEDLPGTSDCRPAPARLWQLTPLQLARSFSALDAELAVPGTRDRFARATTPASPYTSDASREGISTPFLSEAVEIARDVAARWSSTLDTCASTECAEAFFDAAARLAWRRPPHADELARWTETFASFEATHGGAEAGRLVLEAILLSPHHLFRHELGAPSDDGRVRLSTHEVADFIAFTLLDAPPDGPLRRAADDGTLADPAVLEREVRRLLAIAPPGDAIVDTDGRSAPQVPGLLRFFHEWLEVDRIASAPVGELLGELPRDHVVRGLGAERVTRWLGNEPILFARHVLHEGDGKLSTLLGADWTVYGNTLADYYGVPRPPPETGDTTGGRRGLLMQGGFLVGHKSTTHRGRWIRERLFCQPVPNPPPSVDNNLAGIQREAEEEAGRVLSPREVRAAHLAEPCAGCHQQMDPLGFPFDGFDALGLPRETWPGGFEIDTAGEVAGTDRSDTRVDDATELMEHLAQSPDVRACFVRQLFHFVHGRAPSDGDACVLEDLERVFERSDGDVRELAVAMLTHESIWTRLSTEGSR